MYPVIFTQAARAELTGAQDWYEGEVPGSGRRFREAVDALVTRIVRTPLQFPEGFQHVRRAQQRRFPYSLFFVIEGEEIIVIACFHASRNPMRRQERI